MAPAGRTYEFRLNDRLRAARTEAGFSQSELADATGIGLKSVQRYETGLSTPRKLQIRAWALATGFDAGWLETGNPTGPQGPDGEGQRTRRDSNPKPSVSESSTIATLHHFPSLNWPLRAVA